VTAARLPTSLKLFHGFGSIAYGIKDNGFSTFLLIFYNQVLGMDAALVSLALMLALILDAFADPVIGHLSDRTYTRWGRRLPWLYIAPIPLGLMWLLMWAPPDLPPAQMFFYLIVVAIIVRTLLSCCEIPSASLVPELTSDYDERTSLMRFRYLFGWIGGLTLLFLAYNVFLVSTPDYPVGQLNPAGYWTYGVVGAAMMVIAVIVSAMGQHRRVAQWPAERPAPTSIGHAIGEIRESLSHPAFLILMGAGAIAYTSQGVTFSIANYLYLYVWRFSDAAFALYPWLLFGSVLVSFFAVGPVSRRFGKRPTAMVCGLTGAAFWVTPFILRLLGVWPEEGSTASTSILFGFFFMANVFSVMTMICASSMIADIVEASQEQTGRRTEGLFFAGNLFMQKCATGLGIFLTGMIVSLSGMPPQAKPGQVAGGVIDTLTLAYCAVIVIAVIASTLIFARFPINKADHEARLAKLATNSGN
jgi:glycoside/pentoside/hexuronide:cation symporter, GPH family